MKTREQIDAELGRLEHRLPQLIEECGLEDALEGFAAEAECLTEQAPADQLDHIRATISCMLSAAGLIPGENEGESCI